MRTTLRNVLAAGVLIFVILNPRPALAQFDAVTKLFEEVHSITLYGQGTYIDDPRLEGESECAFLSGTLCGVGTEVLIDVAGSGAGHVELGLGASYLRGLAAKDTALEFNAGIRSFPTVSAYITELPFLMGLESYIGANIGVIELQNAQTYDKNGVERGVTGSTFEFGLTGGIFGEILGIGLFGEASHRWRRFSSLDYTLADSDSGRLPASLPRELDLSGLTLSMGLQFRLKADPPEPDSKLWILAAVDAQPLPAPRSTQPSAAGNTLDQKTVLFGMLTLAERGEEIGTYVLDLHVREQTVGADGDLQTIVNRKLETEQGTYSIKDNVITFDPSVPGGLAYSGRISGHELRMNPSAATPGYVFRMSGSPPPAAPAEKK